MLEVGQRQQLPRLQSAQFESLGSEAGDGETEVELTYKSGASFKGQFQNHKKVGKGIFTWPNGSRYEGYYEDNVRTGTGLQLWPDGSRYEGEFNRDMRHGQGAHTWANGESYEGRFFKERRHGAGKYTWPDGSTYTGTFYMDRKEGYGTFQFANGSVFEGLYKEDEREGPGVLTYTDGTQDVGLWHGEKLVKVCTDTGGAFTMKNHQEFDFNPEEHVCYLDLMEEEKLAPLNNIISPPDLFDYLPESEITNKVNEIYSESLDPRSLAVNKDMFDKEFFKETCEEKEDSSAKIVAWNKTPLIISLQKHVHKHRFRQKYTSFNVEKVLSGDRGEFKEQGPLEMASEALLQAAIAGDVQQVEDLLSTGKVHPDVADKSGHTALIGASVNWHMDVINCLLNHGADVNKLNDEGCSALSAGTIFFYPIESFRYNIAERYLEKPPQPVEAKETKTSSKIPPKGILTNKLKPGKKSQTSVIGKQSSGQDTARSESDDKLTDDKRVTVVSSDLSLTSLDSGLPQTESNQSLTASPVNKPQVRIMGRPVKEDDNEQGEITARSSRTDRDSVLEDKNLLDVDPGQEDFDSTMTLRDFEIEVSDQLLDRCATQLSTNERIVGGRRSHNSAGLGRVRHLAVIKNEKERMKLTLDLLLRRGADPNASGVPMPVLFFAIKAADVDMVKTLLIKGASTSITLPKEKGGLAPLHIACAIPGDEGVLITELLLNALANPDVRATEDDSFLNRSLEEEWSKDVISEESKELLGGRTPIQIACARDDNYRHACKVVHLLLQHKANPNLLCNGFSPLALAIASGNDLAIDELLLYGADPSLFLTHGVGSALCISTSTEYEHRRSINGRIQLIDKLIKSGANILSPIAIGPKRLIGTAVDYAYYMFNQDRRIAHMPYHALTHAERETYNARRRLLHHVGDIMRVKAREREKRRLDDEAREGRRSASPSPGFVYIGAGAPLPPGTRKPKFLRDAASESHVTFERVGENEQEDKLSEEDLIPGPARKPLFKYCYECGRSVGVRLSACTRCKEVYYCSKACKLKAWNARHKEECIRVGGRSRSPSPSGRRRGDSPTPATYSDKGKKAFMTDLTRDKHGMKINVPFKGGSKSAKGGRTMGGLGSEDGRHGHSGHLPRPWSPPPGVFVDNYSFV